MTGYNHPDTARQRACLPVWGRLHALRCNGIIRARAMDSEFNALIGQGFALPLFNGPCLRPDQADFIITDRGAARAEELFGTGVWR